MKGKPPLSQTAAIYKNILGGGFGHAANVGSNPVLFYSTCTQNNTFALPWANEAIKKTNFNIKLKNIMQIYRIKTPLIFLILCLKLFISFAFSSDIAKQNNLLMEYFEPDLIRHYLSISPSVQNSFSNRTYETSDYNMISSWSNSFRTSLSLWQYLEILDRNKRIKSDNSLYLNSIEPIRTTTGNDFQSYNDYASLRKTKNTDFEYNLKTSNYYLKYLPGDLHLGSMLQFMIKHRPLSRSFSTTKTIRKGITNMQDTIPDEDEFSISETKTKEKTFYLNPNIKLIAGLGRIEEVTDAASVLNIIDRINELENSNYSITSNQVCKMGQYVEGRRRERDFADLRQASIYDGESMVMFLEGENIPVSKNPRFVLEISDLWDIRRSQRRYSGWTLDFYPQINYWHEITNRNDTHRSGMTYTVLDTPYTKSQLEKMDDFGPSENTDFEIKEKTTSQLDLATESQFIFYRPIRRFFQFQSNITALYKLSIRETNKIQTGSENNKYGYQHYIGGIFFNNSLYWYPNTRTTVSLTTRIHYLKYFEAKDIYFKDESMSVNIPDGQVFFDADSYMNVKYFVTPRLGYNANIRIGYFDRSITDISVLDFEYRPTNSSNSFYVTISASMKYFIF